MQQDFFVDSLHVFTYQTRQELGAQAALMAEREIIAMLQDKPELNIIFAAAPSQNEFLSEIVKCAGIDWSRIHAFHMDEYIGLPRDAPQKFSKYLKDHIFDQVKFKTVHLIDGSNPSPDDECMRYGKLLHSSPPDIVFMGIGENGHIAFNDPPVADFDDPKSVKIVELDRVCRRQQVNDGCFASPELVPRRAITLTIPTLLQAEKIFCMVPGKTKASAVYNTLNLPITTDCPATILRTHKGARLFVDGDSFPL